MDAYVERALDEVRELAHSYERLLRGHPSPAEALRHTEAAFAQLMTTLTRPEVQQRLDAALPQARQQLYRARDEIVRTFLTQRHELLRREAQTLRRLSLGRDDVERMARAFVAPRATPMQESSVVGGADEIRAVFELLHAEVLKRVARARRFPRAAKKRAKKEVRSAAWSLVFGTGAILANLYLPETFIYSFALGSAAIYQATRQLVADTR